MSKGKGGGAPKGNKNASKMYGARKPGLAGMMGVRDLSPAAKRYGAAVNAKAGTKTAIITQSGLDSFVKSGKL